MRTTRRELFRLAAGGLAAATLAGACSSDGEPSGAASKDDTARPAKRRTLRIAQWSHFVPAYDAWFDNEYVKRWGDENDVDVVVDHIPLNELPVRGEAEVAAKRGHDLFWFLAPRPALEDDVIDHGEIVEEVVAKLGALTPHVERSVHNTKTGRYFAFPDHWAAGPIHYRADLWNQVEPGLRPGTWEDVLRAGAPLKAMGHPLGLGFSTDLDSGWTVGSLMGAFGASIQDENAVVTLNSPATVEAVKMGKAVYAAGMTEEIFAWDAFSNNRLLVSGKGSLILNAISAIRAAEQEDAGLGANIALAPVPTASAGDVPRGEYGVGSYVIWNFSDQKDLAKQFLVDLALAYREAFVRSGFYNLPAFPGAVPDLAELVKSDTHGQPADKYAFLADAASWSTNVGHPGSYNAAVDEVFSRFVIPGMFATAARGEMTPEEAVAATEAEIKPIFERWRERGKI